MLNTLPLQQKYISNTCTLLETFASLLATAFPINWKGKSPEYVKYTRWEIQKNGMGGKNQKMGTWCICTSCMMHKLHTNIDNKMYWRKTLTCNSERLGVTNEWQITLKNISFKMTQHCTTKGSSASMNEDLNERMRASLAILIGHFNYFSAYPLRSSADYGGLINGDSGG